MYYSGGDVDGGEGYAFVCGGVGGIWETFALSTGFCCKPTTALNTKFINLEEKRSKYKEYFVTHKYYVKFTRQCP